jgi:hypothetical protein
LGAVSRTISKNVFTIGPVEVLVGFNNNNNNNNNNNKANR